MNEDLMKSLQSLYSLIPDFNCQHCHQCCGPIVWYEPEEILIRNFLYKNKIKRIVWTKEEFELNNMRCPYLLNDRCSIYSVRPMVCRLQGNISQLQCKKTNSNNFLSQKKLKNLKEEYIELIKMTNRINIFYSTLKLDFYNVI